MPEIQHNKLKQFILTAQKISNDSAKIADQNETNEEKQPNKQFEMSSFFDKIEQKIKKTDF
jgi:hypothetical protein